MRPGDADRIVLALARRQHGTVSWTQLVDAGLSPGAIRHRVISGWMVRLHRGVYLVGPVEAPHARAMGATLAVGAGALLSHDSAAVLWELRTSHAGPIHVTAPGREPRHRTGIRVHTVVRLHPTDATGREGIPVTSPARTLLDLAPHLTQRDLTRATDEARIHHRTRDPSLNEQCQRYPHHRGAAALTKSIQTEPALTRSEAERELLELIRAAGLPEPEVNARVGRHEVDFLWRQHNLIVEVDGYAFHSSRSSFERDRRRDADLAGQGIRVVRVTWQQLRARMAVVATLSAALATARP